MGETIGAERLTGEAIIYQTHDFKSCSSWRTVLEVRKGLWYVEEHEQNNWEREEHANSRNHWYFRYRIFSLIYRHWCIYSSNRKILDTFFVPCTVLTAVGDVQKCISSAKVWLHCVKVKRMKKILLSHWKTCRNWVCALYSSPGTIAL